jgi:hypothetical protein
MIRVFLILSILSFSGFSEDLDKNLDDMSFEELMDIEIVSFDGTPKEMEKYTCGNSCHF